MAVGLLAAAAVSPPVAANAQDRGDARFRGLESEQVLPFNVPDESGCVKICLQDLSPCDPPIYKQTDARCSQRRRR